MDTSGDLKQKISELEATVRKLEKDLIHDPLTGLKTRAFFEEEAGVYFDVIANTRSERKNWFGFKNISFIFFDIDHFKSVNDTYGHAEGDCVLVEVAKVIKENIREGDTAARWGGEELVVTLVGATEKDACHKAQDIREKIERLVLETIPQYKLTISAGVASSQQGMSFEDTLKCADKALYEAKRTGRNRVVCYSDITA